MKTNRSLNLKWILERRQDTGIAAEWIDLLCHQLAVFLPPFHAHQPSRSPAVTSRSLWMFDVCPVFIILFMGRVQKNVTVNENELFLKKTTFRSAEEHQGQNIEFEERLEVLLEFCFWTFWSQNFKIKFREIKINLYWGGKIETGDPWKRLQDEAAVNRKGWMERENSRFTVGEKVLI